MERTDEGYGADATKDYLNKIGEMPLLNKQQEIDLAQKIEVGREAWQQLEDSELNADARVALDQVFLEGLEARDIFIRSNLRLVASIAKGYTTGKKSMELLDIIQEGNIGLEHAVDRFDWRKGFKFSTYSTWWIRQAISRGIADKDATIRIPINLDQQIRSAYRNDRPLSESQVEAWRTANTTSYDDTTLGGDGDTPLIDLISDPDPSLPSDNLIKEDAIQRLFQHAGLSERELEVIRLRFGLDGAQGMTLALIGEQFNFTRERARQIEKTALQRLRVSAELLGLSGTVDLS